MPGQGQQNKRLVLFCHSVQVDKEKETEINQQPQTRSLLPNLTLKPQPGWLTSNPKPGICTHAGPVVHLQNRLCFFFTPAIWVLSNEVKQSCYLNSQN